MICNVSLHAFAIEDFSHFVLALMHYETLVSDERRHLGPKRKTHPILRPRNDPLPCQLSTHSIHSNHLFSWSHWYCA